MTTCRKIPRADAHQGEYVAPSDKRLAWLTGFTLQLRREFQERPDARLAWLTGFTGSAGLAASLAGQAAAMISPSKQIDAKSFVRSVSLSRISSVWEFPELSISSAMRMSARLQRPGQIRMLYPRLSSPLQG